MYQMVSQSNAGAWPPPCRAAADPRESIHAFSDSFAAQRQQIETALSSISEGRGTAESFGAPDLLHVAEQAARDTRALAEVRPPAHRHHVVWSAHHLVNHTYGLMMLLRLILSSQFAAASAYFLPPYDLRQATLAIEAPKQQCEDARTALAPRKKFSFGRQTGAARSAAGAADPQPDSMAGRKLTEANAPQAQQADGSSSATTTTTSAPTSASAHGSASLEPATSSGM